MDSSIFRMSEKGSQAKLVYVSSITGQLFSSVVSKKKAGKVRFYDDDAK